MTPDDIDDEPFEGSLPVLEKYSILRKLAAGGMASIYVAERKGSDEICVVKTLHDHLAQDSVVGNRFLREARVASELTHPNIARLTDAKSERGVFYLAMEYIAGHDLESMMFRLMEQRKMLPPELSIRVTLDVLEGLHYAHEYTDADGRHLEIVHRDLSPRNVMITYEGDVKIIDFGLARTNLGEFRTAPGMVLGTLRYMSPEQAVAEPVDRRSDIYSWSVVLYEMLSGRPLVMGNNAQEILHTVVTRIPPPLSTLNGHLPKALDAVLATGMAKEREARFSTAKEMALAIEAAAPELCRTKRHKIGRFVAAVFPDERIDADDLTQRSTSEDGPDYEPTRAGQSILEAGVPAQLEPVPVPEALSLSDPEPEHYAPTNVYVAPTRVYSSPAVMPPPPAGRRNLLWATVLLAVASLVATLATVAIAPKEEVAVAVSPPDPVVESPGPTVVVDVPAPAAPPPPVRPTPPQVEHRVAPTPKPKPPVREKVKAAPPRSTKRAASGTPGKYPWETAVSERLKAGREVEASQILQDRAAEIGAARAKRCAYDAVFWGRPLGPCVEVLRAAEQEARR